MRLSRFYVEESLAIDSSIELAVATSHYIRNVLRLKSGASIALFNGNDAFDYQATLSLKGKQTFADITGREASRPESKLDSTIVQAVSRNEHLDLTLQKCTELGVSRFYIFNAVRSQIPVKAAQLQKKQQHWQAIVVKACEQSGRACIPAISFFNNLQSAIQAKACRQNQFILDFDGQSLSDSLGGAQTKDQVSILIGPEGGLCETEISLAKQQDYSAVRLGPRVLRTETAAMSSLAIVQSLWGDLD